MTTNEKIEVAAAEIIFDELSAEQKAELGTSNPFIGTMTKVEIVREAVKQAQRDGMAYRYGSFAKMIFALKDVE